MIIKIVYFTVFRQEGKRVQEKIKAFAFEKHNKL